MARVLIMGGGCRGRRLAARLRGDGHAVRIVTRDASLRAQIEEVGAECWLGDPNRLATVTGALEGVTIACWLLGGAAGARTEVEALHDSRLRAFLGKLIDTAVRGVIYEAAGSVAADVLRHGAGVAREVASANRIPLREIDADPGEARRWEDAVGGALAELLGVA